MYATSPRSSADGSISESGRFELTSPKAMKMVERTSTVTREWRTGFNEMGVSDAQSDKVAAALRKPRDIGLDAALS